eukprot:1287553-Pyramimonas_sp.AAC.1
MPPPLAAEYYHRFVTESDHSRNPHAHTFVYDGTPLKDPLKARSYNVARRGSGGGREGVRKGRFPPPRARPGSSPCWQRRPRPPPAHAPPPRASTWRPARAPPCGGARAGGCRWSPPRRWTLPPTPAGPPAPSASPGPA